MTEDEAEENKAKVTVLMAAPTLCPSLTVLSLGLLLTKTKTWVDQRDKPSPYPKWIIIMKRALAKMAAGEQVSIQMSKRSSFRLSD